MKILLQARLDDRIMKIKCNLRGKKLDISNSVNFIKSHRHKIRIPRQFRKERQCHLANG